MKTLRIHLALAILWVAEHLNWIAERLLAPVSAPRAPLHPVERLLLGSLFGIAICGLWIWITARAAGLGNP